MLFHSVPFRSYSFLPSFYISVSLTSPNPTEHRPTYTTGRREKSSSNASHPQESMVRNAGAEFHVTNRGGQVTYHGPGQLVGYSMLDLGKMGVRIL